MKRSLIIIITHAATVRVFDRALGNCRVVKMYTSVLTVLTIMYIDDTQRNGPFKKTTGASRELHFTAGSDVTIT